MTRLEALTYNKEQIQAMRSGVERKELSTMEIDVCFLGYVSCRSRLMGQSLKKLLETVE